MALGKPRDVVTYPDLEAKNLAVGEGDNAVKRIDGVYFDANETDRNNALAVRTAWGVDLVDNGSVVGECRVTTPSGIFDAEHNVTVGDGTRLWKTTMTADDDLRFDDTDIVNGAAGPADYSSAAFIDSLVVWSTGSDTVSIVVDNTEMVLTYDATNALTGDDIARSPVVSEVLDTSLTNVETALGAEHNGATGAHDAEFLANAMFDHDEVFIGEGFANLIANGDFARWPRGPKNAPSYDPATEGWDEYNATVEQESSTVKFGVYSAKIITSGANQGLKYTIEDFEDFQGRQISVAGWIKVDSAGGVEIRIDDGVGTTTGTAVTLSASWQRVMAQRTIDAGATKLEIYFVSQAGASPTFYLDGVAAFLGRVYKTYNKSVLDEISDDDVIPINYLLNPGFECWADGGAPYPDYWAKHGSGSIDVDPGFVSYAGAYSLAFGKSAAMGAGTGVVQKTGLLDMAGGNLTSKKATLSAWFRLPAADPALNTWAIEIYDGTNTYTTQFEASDLSSSAWTQVSVTGDIATSAGLECRIYSVDGELSADTLYVDGACLNIGGRPMAGAGQGDAPSALIPVEYHFKHSGALSSGNYVDLGCPISRWFYPLRIDVYALTGPGQAFPGGYATFTLRSSTFGTAPAVNILSVQLDAEVAPDADGAGYSDTNTFTDASTDVIAKGDYIRVYMELSGTNADPEDIWVVVKGFTL